MIDGNGKALMTVSLDLDELFTDEWNNTVAEMLRDEVKNCIRIEMKKALSEDKNFKKLVRECEQLGILNIMSAMAKLREGK